MKENLGLRVLALVIAIVLWAYVRVTTNPAGREVLAQITLTLPLERQGNAPNLIPYEYSAETVDVTLEGESRVVKQLREGLVRAYVDLNGMTAGSHWPEVKVLYPPEVRLVDQEPRSVNVKISPLLAKEVPVEVKVGGTAADGMSTGEVSVDPDRVKIQGPEALVNEVARVRGRILLDGQSRTFTADVTGLTPVSENGTPVSGNNYQVRVAPKRVAATVPIESKGTLMGVPVALENARVAIREGYRYSMRADPSVVTIRVAKNLEPPTVIKTEAVDFGSPTTVVEQEVALLPP
ncbi:MAG: hypothetical protein KC910_23090, partial [Candidatus Eremiobacteraeota bacterium]|nr:hypothetical protein [Candidatus Eremiobacteraeota bacterium]